MDYFKEKFDGILAKNLNVPLEELAPEKEFKEDFNLDSLDMIEMIIAFEKEFSINIPDEIAESIKTISDAENAVRARVHNTNGKHQ
jgi:acyl carrier protein